MRHLREYCLTAFALETLSRSLFTPLLYIEAEEEYRSMNLRQKRGIKRPRIPRHARESLVVDRFEETGNESREIAKNSITINESSGNQKEC